MIQSISGFRCTDILYATDRDGENDACMQAAEGAVALHQKRFSTKSVQTYFTAVPYAMISAAPCVTDEVE